MKKVFSFDAESDGLWGSVFAIAAIVYDENGKEEGRFLGRLPDKVVTNDWVKENVLPQLADVPITHQDLGDLLADFAEFYLAKKAEADVIVHMGVPVESNLLQEMYSRGLIGDWDGPFPLIDLAGMLLQAGEDPTSVDGYAEKFGLKVGDFGSSHNPLYDSEVAARVFLHLQGR